jgi:hypothetical protein
MAKRTKVSIHAILAEHPHSAKEFLASPEAFAQTVGFDLADLVCPPEVHCALERGRKLAEDVLQCGIEPSPGRIKKLSGVARKHFGKGFSVSFIPFGLRFQEKIKIDPRVDWTASGTATVTWLDGDGDVDG